MHRVVAPAALVPLLLSLALGFASPSLARPKLAVIVVFDQLRPVELDKYAPFFGDGGFGGLDGARFDALYSFAATETGPGHATLATGANPDVHGVGTNWWYRGTERRYAVDDPAFPVIGAADKSGRSPVVLAVPTLGDAMKADNNGATKVVTLSFKDRSAILMGGLAGDLAVWYDPAQGRFTSSTYYGPALPAWLDDKGRSIPAKTITGATWSPLPIPATLAELAPPDDRRGEAGHEGWGATFPHDITDQPEALRRKLYRMTPQAMDDLFALALVAVDELKLGRDAIPDLLVVSVSTTDYVGHNYGPDSLEQLDLLRRADASLRRFTRALDDKIGRRQIVWAVASDHGSPPPPASVSGRVPHGVVVYGDITKAAESAAAKLFPTDKRKRVLGFSVPQLFLDFTDLSASDQRKLIDAVIAAVEAIPGIANVYDMTIANNDEDALAPLMRASAFPGRSAALFVRQAPRVVFMEKADANGTDHGTPYTYDRRIPLIVAGPGVKRGHYAQPVDARDLAPTIAFLLGVSPPDVSFGKPVIAVGD